MISFFDYHSYDSCEFIDSQRTQEKLYKTPQFIRAKQFIEEHQLNTLVYPNIIHVDVGIYGMLACSNSFLYHRLTEEGYRKLLHINNIHGIDLISNQEALTKFIHKPVIEQSILLFIPNQQDNEKSYVKYATAAVYDNQAKKIFFYASASCITDAFRKILPSNISIGYIDRSVCFGEHAFYSGHEQSFSFEIDLGYAVHDICQLQQIQMASGKIQHTLNSQSAHVKRSIFYNSSPIDYFILENFICEREEMKQYQIKLMQQFVTQTMQYTQDREEGEKQTMCVIS
ncbi:MAG: hypothetical protein Q8R83_09195 [Legionellaceae bacterium]|nr:hypothetical protein [Legionellaceae bacterium]